MDNRGRFHAGCEAAGTPGGGGSTGGVRTAGGGGGIGGGTGGGTAGREGVASDGVATGGGASGGATGGGVAGGAAGTDRWWLDHRRRDGSGSSRAGFLFRPFTETFRQRLDLALQLADVGFEGVQPRPHAEGERDAHENQDPEKERHTSRRLSVVVIDTPMAWAPKGRAGESVPSSIFAGQAW